MAHRCADIVVIAMPWAPLASPSIQLGILSALAERDGIRCVTRHFYLEWMEYLAAGGENSWDRQQFQVEDYYFVAQEAFRFGAGDWVFSGLDAPKQGVDNGYTAYMRRNGIDDEALAKIECMKRLAPAFVKHCLRRVLEANPSVVGFSISAGQCAASIALAAELKLATPKLKIICGGPGCAGEMGSAILRSFKFVDFVVRGDAEPVFGKLVADILVGKEIVGAPGLCYRKGEDAIVCSGRATAEDLNATPPCRYESYFRELEKCPTVYRAIAPFVSIPFESSRGCWWGEKKQCRFCGLNGEAIGFRRKSANRVGAELMEYSRSSSVLSFRSVDNVLDMHNLRPLFEKLAIEKNDLEIYYEVRAGIKKSDLMLLKRAGVTFLHPGIESLSTPILHLMSKGVSAFENVRMLKWLAELGIRTSWNLICGIPGEEVGHYEEMLCVMSSLTHLAPPRVNHLRIDRFSPYFDHPSEFGLRITGPAEYLQYVYALDDDSLRDLAYTFEESSPFLVESLRGSMA